MFDVLIFYHNCNSTKCKYLISFNASLSQLKSTIISIMDSLFHPQLLNTMKFTIQSLNSTSQEHLNLPTKSSMLLLPVPKKPTVLGLEFLFSVILIRLS